MAFTKSNTVGIIGMGWVGSSVAISLVLKGLVKKLLVHDVRRDIAEGEALDLRHGAGFVPSVEIHAAEIEDMMACGLIVITAGRGGKPGESRLELIHDNIGIAKDISQKLKGYTGILIIVSNPVDVLTYWYREFTGLPAGRVIGTGTFLDSARLRQMIGTKIGVEPKSIWANVIGEHGDSSVLLWSKAVVGGTALREWHGWEAAYEDDLKEEVHKAAQEIIRRKGATNHAIGLVTASLVKWLLRGERRVVALSTSLDGPHGLSGLALSLPCLISQQGVERVIEVSLAPEEKAGLMHSAEVVGSVIDQFR